MKDKHIWNKVVEMCDKGIQGALATVIETKGSAPGKSGFKIILTENGETFGTIGGGCVEIGVIEIAKEVIKDKKFRTFNFALTGKDAVCGGSVRVMIEPIG